MPARSILLASSANFRGCVCRSIFRHCCYMHGFYSHREIDDTSPTCSCLEYIMSTNLPDVYVSVHSTAKNVERNSTPRLKGSFRVVRRYRDKVAFRKFAHLTRHDYIASCLSEKKEKTLAIWKSIFDYYESHTELFSCRAIVRSVEEKARRTNVLSQRESNHIGDVANKKTAFAIANGWRQLAQINIL